MQVQGDAGIICFEMAAAAAGSFKPAIQGSTARTAFPGLSPHQSLILSGTDFAGHFSLSSLRSTRMIVAPVDRNELEFNIPFTPASPIHRAEDCKVPDESELAAHFGPIRYSRSFNPV